jgi:NAD(P)-dependent dehydrogenase (short-subunit alcohol dehydrogenase family)
MSGRVAIVTGAARGLGAAYCLGLARNGMRVVAGDLRDCTETVKEVDDGGGQALAVELDVTDAGSARAMVAAALDAFGRVDVLVNNAAMYGNLHTSTFDTIEETEWDACMAVNVKGLWQCAKAVVPPMREQGGGSIVNISSLAAVYGFPNFLHYSTSKAAVIGLTRALAREVGRHGIRVNAVAPGMVGTPGTTEAFRDNEERFAEAVQRNQSIRKVLDTDDLVGTVLYLAGDQSRFVTGQTIMVDGGSVFL